VLSRLQAYLPSTFLVSPIDGRYQTKETKAEKFFGTYSLFVVSIRPRTNEALRLLVPLPSADMFQDALLHSEVEIAPHCLYVDAYPLYYEFPLEEVATDNQLTISHYWKRL
jgi:hypothetical protein